MSLMWPALRRVANVGIPSVVRVSQHLNQLRPIRLKKLHPIRLNLKRGSVWVQDGRAYHRGTPNRSDHPRDELCMAFCRPWLFSQWQHEYTEKHFPRELWESLSPHSKEVLRWQRVKDV